MIRDSVLLWGTLTLLVVLAFLIIPGYERFKDASGKEVDVSPDAPAMPEWLKPIDERTGKKATYKNIFGQPEPTASKDPLPSPGWLNPAGLDFFYREQFENPYSNWLVYPFRETFENESAEPDVVQNIMPAKKLGAMSDVPSGVKVPPAQSMPPNKLLGTVNEAVETDKKVISRTLPAPKFEDPYNPSTQAKDKYVLKSSLVPCSITGVNGPVSRVPGDMDQGGIMDDPNAKPFSIAFQEQEDPVGYLNSFSAFNK